MGNKKIFFGVIVLIGLVYFMNSNSNTDKKTNTSTNNTNNDKALIEIRKEKKVKEAIITEANVLYVSVVDDGTRRDGYAEYLCQILKENGSNINWVKVTKVNSTNDPNRDNAYGVLLGESHCQ
jgi:aspartokinase